MLSIAARNCSPPSPFDRRSPSAPAGQRRSQTREIVGRLAIALDVLAIELRDQVGVSVRCVQRVGRAEATRGNQDVSVERRDHLQEGWRRIAV